MAHGRRALAVRIDGAADEEIALLGNDERLLRPGRRTADRRGDACCLDDRPPFLDFRLIKVSGHCHLGLRQSHRILLLVWLLSHGILEALGV
jgi:hypothetical protein